MLGILLFTALNIFAQKSEIFNPKEGAIHGYDPVAYFKESKPVKGDPEFSVSWKGTNWYFANQENKDAFKASPEKYSPQYGGYCAYGLADGHKAPTSPDAWTIIGGKLYFNYDKGVQKSWNKKQPEYIKTADANWPKVKNEE